MNSVVKTSEPKCGIVMPISAIDGCDETHWADVLEIISDAVVDAGFSANLVSNSDEVGIIQKRIIQNLYDNPVVVVDVSGKNSNVMFELGMRLAFDKPTIIIKDDLTSYSFDTAPIEHLTYPRDLRFNQIIQFKDRLREKIKATYLKSQADGGYTTFLKHFGEFKVVTIDEKEVSEEQYIIEELRNLRRDIALLSRYSNVEYKRRPGRPRQSDFCFGDQSEDKVREVFDLATALAGPSAINLLKRGNHWHIAADLSGLPSEVSQEVLALLRESETGGRHTQPAFSQIAE